MIFSGRMLTCSLRFFFPPHEGIRHEDDTEEKPNVYFFFFMKVLLVVFNLRFTGKPGSGTLQTSGVWRHVLSVCVCVVYLFIFSYCCFVLFLLFLFPDLFLC